MAADETSEDLFFDTLVESYVGGNPRFLRRAWLADEVEARLARSDCRFVLLTGEPGVGKSGFMAQLAADHAEWPRYFIRRDQFSALSDVSAHSFLLRAGYQLAARRPELFADEHIRIAVEQRIGAVVAGGQAIGAEVERLVASPFHRNVLRVVQHVANASGRVVGMTVGELVVEPRLIDVADLANMALFDPARALYRIDPGARIVVLVDALDEVRYHNTGDNLLEWLANCPELPPNVRFVLSSRPPDGGLRRLMEKQSAVLLELPIAPEDPRVVRDIQVYVERWLSEPALAAGLSRRDDGAAAQAARLSSKANGNVGYLDALARAIDSATSRQDADMLASLLDLQRLPDSLQMLYAHFLHQIAAGVARQRVEVTDPDTGERYDKATWPAVDSRILGVLCVALEPLPLARIAALADVRAGWEYLSDAIGRLRQFLDLSGDRYRIYHATVVEFLTADATRNETSTSDLYVDPVRWNRQVADVLWRARQDRWSTLDAYGLNSLAVHLSRSGDAARLGALIEKHWMLARYAGSGYTYTGYVSDVDLALQRVVDGGSAMTAELCRLHVARQLAVARVDAYRVEDLLMLAQLGRKDEALANAQLRSDPAAAFAVLMGVNSIAADRGERDSSLLEAAASAAAAIREEQARCDALIKLALALTRANDERATSTFDEACELAGRLRPEVVLPSLAAALAEAGDSRADRAFAEARAHVDRMDYDPDSMRWQRPDARLELVRALLRARRFTEAEDVADTMREDGGLHGDEAWRTLVEVLAESGRLAEAEQASSRIHDAFQRTQALCAVATAMLREGGEGAAARLEQALQTAAQVQGTYACVSSLARVGAALARASDPRARGVFARARETLDGSRGLLSDSARPVLAEWLARAGLVDEAREVSHTNADALRRVVAALAEAGDGRAGAIFGEVLALVQAGSGAVARSPIPIAKALVACGRADAARKLAPFANWDYGRAQVLQIAAEGLVAAGRIDDARAVIASIQEPDRRARALAALAARVNRGTAGPDLLTAEAMAAGNTNRLRALASALAQAGEGRLAMRAVAALDDEWERHHAAIEVVEQLASIGSFDQAAEIALGIRDATSQGQALVHLVRGLCAAGQVDRAQELAACVTTRREAAVAWRQVGATMAAGGDGRSADAFTRAWAAADDVPAGRERVLAYVELAGAMIGAGDRRSGDVFEHALAAQEDLRGWERSAVASLAVVLDRAGDARASILFDEALAATGGGVGAPPASRRTGDPTTIGRGHVIDALIAAGRVDRVHEAVADLAEDDRIRHLVAAGVALSGRADPRVLEYLREARSLCQYVPDEPRRLMELEKIAGAMATGGYLHEALITARPHHLDRYVGHLAEWAPVLERQAPGLSIQALCAASAVAAWFYDDWAKINAILSEQD